MKMYDLIIIGGSAAATAAGVYAARRNLDFKIISKDFGGEVATSGDIGNWPGANHTDGITLSEQFRAQLEYNKVNMEEGVEVERVSRQSDGMFCITTVRHTPKMASEKVEDDHEVPLTCDYLAKSVIVATGVHPRQLTVPGEKEYRNKGVSYCTVCDGPLFAEKPTAVVGGGNSALEAALMMTDIASKVYVINKNKAFKGEDVLINNLKKKPNAEILYNARTTEIVGEQFVNGLFYADEQGQSHHLKVDGIFVHIGMVPNSQLVPQEIAKDQFGQIKVNANCETSVPGLFAAGDVTDVPFKQIVIAAGQGSIAALSAVAYLNRMDHAKI